MSNITTGDVIEYYSGQAGHTKYHICVAIDVTQKTATFLFINSDYGYRGDCVFTDGEISCIPTKSKSGKSVVSFSQLVRANEKQLRLFQAKKIGSISKEIAKRLYEFAQSTDALPIKDKKMVQEAFKKLV